MPEFLIRDDAPDLAYIKTEATPEMAGAPAIMFLGGFRSDMEGTKAIYFEKTCKERGQAYIRFDYRGHGQSKGKFEEACIGEWTQDALDILERCTSGPVILVGSSMGGWIALLIALQQAEHVQAIIGLATAPDFTKWMEAGMSEDQKEFLRVQGYFELLNDYGNPYIITQKLLEDGRRHSLLDGTININIPVRLIQGMKDADVEWQTAHRIKNAVSGTDVQVFLLEDADHRLSSPKQLEMINGVICDLF